jgi:hypothetical protein
MTVTWKVRRFLPDVKTVYTFDLGSPEVLDTLTKKAGEIAKLVDGAKDAEIIAKIRDAEKKSLALVFDSKTIADIEKRSGGNIFATIQIINAVCELSEKGMDEIKQGL